MGDFVLNAALATTNQALNITAGDIILASTINSGAAATTILATNGGSIGLGATAGAMTITGVELQNITATGLTLGSNTSGTVTVNGISAANSNTITGALTINSGSSIVFSGANSTFNSLIANADDGITLTFAPTTDTGSLALDGDADNAADTKDNITFSSGMTLTSADALRLDGATGGLSAAGALTLNADGNMTLAANLTVAGHLIAAADADSSNAGNFSATSVNAGANNVTVSGIGVSMGSALVASTATLDGAITGTGVNVTALVLTGPSAVMTGIVNGVSGAGASALVTMIDAPTHTFNGCSLSGCVVATSLSTEDQVNASLDAIFQVTVAVAVETTLDPLVTEIATPQFDIEVTQETTDSNDTLVGGTSGPRNDEIGGERDDEICTGVSTGGPGDMTNDRDC